MKKNNRGFTLVELLASIVILGILMAIAVPTILGMLKDNRDAMYIDAAKKMISQAEYKMRSSSSIIEKPNKNDVIAMSLVYLDSNDFDNAPNNGEYLKEASFVVIKNIGNNKLEYSATIVEKMKKGGYKGIKLTKDSLLNGRNANKFVTTFKEDEIVYIEGEDKNNLTTDIINKSIATNYCGNLEMIYNYPGLVDDSLNEKNNPPKITSINIKNNSNQNINSFKAVLTVNADDDRTLKRNLKVHTSLESINDAINSSGENFGDLSNYQKEFDFSSYGYNGEAIKIYVVVKDEQGNYAREEVTYTLHNNRAPVISDSSKITKRSNDSKNMPQAILNLDVSDDLDSKSNLKICLSLEKNNCNDYKSYDYYFKNKNFIEYDFLGIPDGREVTLYVFVKDSMGAVSKKAFDYQIYKNTKPVIEKVEILSNDRDLSNTDGGSLTTKIKVQARDDFSTSSLKVKIFEGANFKQFNYSDNIIYTFTGDYDGSIKSLKVVVVDEYGLESDEETVIYKLYKNEPPKIDDFTVTSSENLCNSNECNGGSINTKISIKVSDDLDKYSENLKICYSDNEDLCFDKNSKKYKTENFKKYDLYNSEDIDFELSHEISDTPYNGDIKKVYLYVMDSYGEVSSKNVDYKLYQNQSPYFLDEETGGLEIVSMSEIESSLFEEEFINVNKAKLNINVLDDLDENTDLEIQVCKKLKGSDKSNCSEYEKFLTHTGTEEDIYNDHIVEFSEDDGFLTYDGQEYTVTVKIKDRYGAVCEKSVDYQLYKDKSPVINNFYISSENVFYNSNIIEVNYSIYDVLDTYSLCIGTDNSFDACKNKPLTMSQRVNGTYNDNGMAFFENQNGSVFEYHQFLNILPELYDKDNRNTKIYLHVKDSKGNVVSKSIDYEQYKLCFKASSENEFSRDYIPVDTNNVIDAKSCNGKCYVDNNSDNKIVSYFHSYLYNDRYFKDTRCQQENKREEKNCSFYKCFLKSDESNLDSFDTFYKAVGINEINEGYTDIVDGEEIFYDSYHKIYEVHYDKYDDSVTLIETPFKMSSDKYNEGLFKLDDLENSYVLVDDDPEKIIIYELDEGES